MNSSKSCKQLPSVGNTELDNIYLALELYIGGY